MLALPKKQHHKTTHCHPLTSIFKNNRATKQPARSTYFATAMPPKLIKPTKPYLPVAPQPPKRARFKYQPKFPQSLFISKAKIKEIEEDRFRRKMKAHEKSNQMYQQRFARYEQNLKNYAQQDSVFAPQQQQWDSRTTKPN
jgi:hypothetical protein